MLDVLLPAYGHDDIVMPFEPHQAVDAVSLGESFQFAGSVLVNSAHDIGGDPDVKDPVRPIRDDVDPAAFHDANVAGEGFRFVNGKEFALAEAWMVRPRAP